MLTNVEVGHSQQKGFLARAAKPQQSDLLAPIAQDRSRSDILTPFYKHLAQSLPSESPLAKLEAEMMGSSGSFSLREAGWWREGVAKFRDKTHAAFPSRGFELLKSELAQFRTTPLRVAPSPHWNTNAGFPYYVRADRVESDVLGDIESIISSTDFRKDAESWPYLLGWRGQPKRFPDVTKSRVVWMEAKSWAAVTSMFTYPVIQSLKRSFRFCQLAGPEYVDMEIGNAMVGRNKGFRFLSGDKSAFDASISREILFGAIDVVRSLLVLTPQQEELFYSCFRRMVDKSLLTPDGLVTVDKGVPSGHGATNLIDSIITVALIFEMLGPVWCLAGGDDDVCSLPNDVSVKHVEEFYAAHGITAHPEKQLESTDCILFLSRLFGNVLSDGNISRGVRPLMRALNGIISLERPKLLTRYDHTLRIWSQLAEVEYHPYRHLLLQECIRMDKYGLFLGSQSEIQTVLRNADPLPAQSEDLAFRLSNKPIYQWWIFREVY